MKTHYIQKLAILLAITLLILPTLRADRGAGENNLPPEHGTAPAPVADGDFYGDGKFPAEKNELGRLLFFDKILSGNRNISCATCHHPDHGTSDGVALSLGEGASGLGPKRRTGKHKSESVHGRISRNSPALFNLGASEFTRLFHDGRVETDEEGFYEGGFITPAKWKLPAGLENPLAAQAMFPVTSPDEMAGQKGENPIADASSLNRAAGPTGVWELIAKRLRAIPEYQRLFQGAFPDEIRSPQDITFVHAANAIAAFETVKFRADQSPFDRLLRGETNALDPKAIAGMRLFYGKARCAECHSGKFQTDHEFHAIAMPQLGPGKGDGKDATFWRATGMRGFLEDFGRGRVTARPQDNFKFRTPSLRNTALTGPWGHAGAYATLEDVVRHHSDPKRSLEVYTPPDDLLPPLARILELTVAGSQPSHEWLSSSRAEGFLKGDGWIASQPHLRARVAAASELDPVALTEPEIDALVAFLESLTDPSSRRLSSLIPARVPSGLSVND